MIFHFPQVTCTGPWLISQLQMKLMQYAEPFTALRHAVAVAWPLSLSSKKMRSALREVFNFVRDIDESAAISAQISYIST